MKRLALVLACAGCGGSVAMEPAADAMPPVSDGPTPTLLVATPSTSRVHGGVSVLAVDASDRLYILPIMGSGRVARYTPDLVFDRELGFDHAIAVRCATSGTCWIFGRDGITVPSGPVDPYAIRIDP